MADVTTVFAAKDESFAKTVGGLQNRLTEFGGGVESFNGRVATMAKGFQGMIGPLIGIGAAVLGAKGAMDSFRSALDIGGKLDDLTKTTGATAGELAILQRAFQLAGSSVEAVGPAMNRLNRFMAEAGSGATAQKETLNALGLTYQDLASKTPLEQMRMLAERIGAIGSPARRTAAAMDIFGKSGGDLVPLFREFNSEISKAEGQLGGLPAILDSNAQSLAEMGDVVDALSSKFDEFTIGLIAGAQGAQDFSTALANIDSAGFGQNIGQSLRIAFEQPLLTSKIIGETLLTGIKVAGNTLINASLFAAESFVKTISAEQYAVGLGERIRAGLMEAINAFNKILAYGVEKIFLQPLSNLPGIIGDPFRAALASVQSIRETLDATSQANFALWEQGGEKIKDSVNQAVNSTEILSKDWLGVAGSAANVANNIQLASDAVATTLAPAAEAFLTSLQESTIQLQQSEILSSNIALNLESAALSSDRVAPAFSLSEESSEKVAMDLESTVPAAEQASEFLAEGASATNALDINGRSYAASAAAAASNIAGAKVDARITADVFTGMSDRMKTGANAVNEAIDKLREAHHFGKQTMDEVYQKARDSGQSIIEAQKTASEAMRAQEKATSEMRSAEEKVHNAARAKQNAADRADRMEAAGQTRAAHELRMRAEAEFAKKMEALGPEVQKAAEAAARALDEAGKNIDTSGDSLGDGGSAAENAMTSGGEAAASALKEAIVPSEKAEETLTEIYKFLKDTFFKDFQKRLPQNALS
jgi:hypothetical protein